MTQHRYPEPLEIIKIFERDIFWVFFNFQLLFSQWKLQAGLCFTAWSFPAQWLWVAADCVQSPLPLGIFFSIHFCHSYFGPSPPPNPYCLVPLLLSVYIGGRKRFFSVKMSVFPFALNQRRKNSEVQFLILVSFH